MPVALVGVDHTTCPVSVRESLVVSRDQEIHLLKHLSSSSVIDEVLILSTCARTEVYVVTDYPGDARSVVCDSLESLNPEARGSIVFRTESEAVEHLFRVTGGLESQIVGEYEIAGQVRTAVQSARAAGTVGPELDTLFQAAIRCSRRLRRESDLGRLDLSVAGATVSLVRQSREIGNASVLILGSGKVARLLAQEFQGARRLVIGNRNTAAAQSLASRFDGDSMTFEEAVQRLGEFDVVCCATRSRDPVLKVDDVRKAAPLEIYDLSLPRNVEVAAGQLPGVVLHDVDAVSPAPSIRSEDADLIESIVESEVHDYMSRQSIRMVAPIISALRAHVDHVRAVETARIGPRLQKMEPGEIAAVEELTGRLIDRMFHHLVVRLKLAALTDPELIKAAEFFFAHGEDSVFPGPTSIAERDSVTPASTGASDLR
jgi:glutamyl-tRNA reductase